jgi:hypothetical protein
MFTQLINHVLKVIALLIIKTFYFFNFSWIGFEPIFSLIIFFLVAYIVLWLSVITCDMKNDLTNSWIQRTEFFLVIRK